MDFPMKKVLHSMLLICMATWILAQVQPIESDPNGESNSIKGISIPNPKTVALPKNVSMNVVHIAQNDNVSCATTSVAMAISYYEGENRDPLDKEIVWEISGTSENDVLNYGNDMKGLARIAKYFGYRCEYADHLTFFDLEYLLSRNILVVVNIRAADKGTASHAVLLTGYDIDREVFYENDPATNEYYASMRFQKLEKRWTANLSSPRGLSKRSGFIIYPKN